MAPLQSPVKKLVGQEERERGGAGVGIREKRLRDRQLGGGQMM